MHGTIIFHFQIIFKIFAAKLFINTTVPTPEELVRLFPHIQAGGHWQPDHCQQRQKLGILIPLRNRWSHAAVLLRHLHQLLVRQWRHYTIYVIEQAGKNGNPKMHFIPVKPLKKNTTNFLFILSN